MEWKIGQVLELCYACVGRKNLHVGGLGLASSGMGVHEKMTWAMRVIAKNETCQPD